MGGTSVTASTLDCLDKREGLKNGFERHNARTGDNKDH